MSASVFSISSPDLERRGQRMAGTDIGIVARTSAVKAAGTLVTPLKSALRQAGGAAAARDVRVHDGHLNDLVMREQGRRGDVIVGVGGESPHADVAEELEWGGLDVGPKAWVRTTVAQRAFDVVDHWSRGLTTELDRRCS